MSPKTVSRLASFALVAVFTLTGVFTLWSSHVDEKNTEELTEAAAMSELYTEASKAIQQAETYTLLWTRSADPELLVEEAKAEASFNELIGQIGQSSDPEHREFGNWANEFLLPMSAPFARLREPNPPPYEEILGLYEAAYIQMYESVLRGEPGAPAIAASLTDPATVSSPTELANPITVIMRLKATESELAAERALQSNAEAEELFGVMAPVLYAMGIILVIWLLNITQRFGRREALAVYENEHLRRVSTTDALTHLGNRRGFEEATKRLTGASASGVSSLVMMDLDEFKVVNDTFGHARGDRVLVNFAEVLNSFAPAGASRFRVGGDEFALILHGLDGNESLALAEAIRVAASEALGNSVTVSAGVAVLEAGNGDESLMLQQADAALYEGKLRGRNLAVLYQGDGHAQPLFASAKLQAVRRLLEEGRIGAVFQPIWDLSAQTLLGYEGLSRPDDDYGLDGPQQAFDIAEQFGHAADLDKLCRNHLLAAASKLPEDSRLFLNLSPYSLTHHAFSPDMLIAEMAAAGVEKTRVVFEITEKSNVPTSAIAEAVIALRSSGLSVALDDVGAGNNGLEMLRKVSFDYVKVDRGVILAASESGNGRAGLMAILAFSSESDAIVVAEGIEDLEMFELVRDLSTQTMLRGKPGLIHGVQGYLFGRPLPAEQAARDLPPELAA